MCILKVELNVSFCVSKISVGTNIKLGEMWTMERFGVGLIGKLCPSVLLILLYFIEV